MSTIDLNRNGTAARSAVAWLPLVVMPMLVLCLGFHWPAWVFMWVLAISIYAGLKWLTFWDNEENTDASLRLSLGYLLLWPGMDANAFFSLRHPVKPALSEWTLAICKTVFGITLILAAPLLMSMSHLFAGWIGMAGIVFLLHFGVFHLLSLAWRCAGVDARPIMDFPFLAKSLSDFWGRRWNLAFRDLSYSYLFRPWVRRLGTAGATMLVFLASGVIHDLVISIPARGGYGLPTVYFLIQGLGLLIERSKAGKWLGLSAGLIGRVFCMLVTLAPVCLLFHRPFIERVVLPMFATLGVV